MKTEDILFLNTYEENKKVLDELKIKISDNNNSDEWMLCLGAGVSMSAGLPNWYGLLARITAQIISSEPHFSSEETKDVTGDKGAGFRKAYYKDVNEFYQKFSNATAFYQKMEKSFSGEYEKVFNGINVLEAAEYIRNFVEQSLGQQKENLTESKEIREKTNRNMNYFIQEACKDALKDNWENDETTLAAVAGLMKNDKRDIVHNVITYNYDNLLEHYLRDISGCEKEKVFSIIKENEMKAFKTKDGWNIYHIHGRLPVIEYPGEDMSKKVILTESDYYEEENLSYSWTNTLQSYAIMCLNIIFIGFSGTDYNFRRIIKYIDEEKADNKRRYIFFLVDDIVKAVLGKDIKNEKDCIERLIKKMNQPDSEYAYEKLLINYMIQAQTSYWRKHKLDVIWSSIEELPDNLRGLYNDI